jgi:peptidoglycan/xylan/chitin deacetylase (PgdA/CDA1 family)
VKWKWGHSSFPSKRGHTSAAAGSRSSEARAISSLRAGQALLAAALLLTAGAVFAQQPRVKIALTFDDLPLNGGKPASKTLQQIAADTVAVLKAHHIPPSFGFISPNGRELEPDGARALQVWIDGGNPLGNHTYTHLSLTKNSVADFEKEILRNEPILERLTPPGAHSDWRWLRYPFLHEGDTLEKRRAVREFLRARGYRVAQTTIDWEDYLWNGAHARCVDKQDAAAIEWLRSSYLSEAQRWIRAQRGFARQVWGRDINHVALLHLGSFSATILPELFKLLEREGFEIVTLEEAQSDPAYDSDPDIGEPNGSTLTELMMRAKNIPWPEGLADKPREQLKTICSEAGSVPVS